MSEGTDLVRAQDQEPTSLEELSHAGKASVARQREINAIFRSLEDSMWGKVRGRNLSEGSRYALARMCHLTRADYTVDIDLLGGHPYHNANYFIRRAMNHARYVEHEEKNILRDLDLREEWGVPDDATGACLVTITLFRPSAPMAAIQDGRIPFDEAMKWTTRVSAANWAGDQRNRKSKDRGWYKMEDAIGKGEPDKTARTRAFRKASHKAFGMEFMDEQAVQKAEKILEAEWDYEPETTAPEGGAIVGQGEPSAVMEPGAPVEADYETVVEPEPEPEPEVNIGELRGRYFVTLKDLGLKGDAARKAFQTENLLPDSVKTWTPDDYERAQQALMDPLTSNVEALCKQYGTSLEDISLQVLQMQRPEYARHWKLLETTLEMRLADHDPNPGAGAQGELDHL